jgi:APA family basic amino acid/polyamine antiporter
MTEKKSHHSPHLLKSFGLNMAIVIVVSNIIGSGVFKKVAPMSELLLSGELVILAWILAGIVALFGVLSIAEVGAMYPSAGGAYVWLEKMYGKPVSFYYGWACFTVIQSAAIASIAYVFAGAIDTFISLPELSPALQAFSIGDMITPFDNFGAKLIASLLICLLTVINIRGAKHSGFVSQLFTWLIIGCIFLIIASGLSSAVGNFANYTKPSVSYPPADFSTTFGFIGVMIIAMRHAFWGYEGWMSLGFVGEEIRNPEKNIPRSLIIGIFIVMGLYILLNFTYLYVMSVDELLNSLQLSENSIAAVIVVNKIFGEGGAYIVSAMILVSTLGCTNTTILSSSRIYYAMAQHGLFFKKAASCHPIYKTPSYALFLQCIWACVLVFSGSFDMLTDLLIFAAFIFYGLIVFGVMILRWKEKDKPRPYKAIGYPFVPIIFVSFCIVLLIVSIYENPLFSLVGLGLILSGTPFYLLWRQR